MPMATNQAHSAFEDIILKHLGLLLPGARLSGPFSGRGHTAHPVSHDTGNRLLVRAGADQGRYHVFDRIVPFSDAERSFCAEVVEKARPGPAEGGESGQIWLADLVARTIARRLAPDCAESLHRLILNYQSWPRAAPGHTCGLRPARLKGRINFFDLSAEEVLRDWAVSGNFLISLDYQGRIIGPEKTAGRQSRTRKNGPEPLCPLAWADIAAWTGPGRKTAVRLNEDGQILIFKGRRLMFFKRGRYWQSLPHTLTDLERLPESIEGLEAETVRAIYQTALDLAASQSRVLIELFRNSRDESAALRCEGNSEGAEAFQLPGRGPAATPFPEMPRRARARLCVQKGCLLLDGRGRILNKRPGCRLGRGTKSRGGIVPGSGYMQLLNNEQRPGLYLKIH